MLLTEAFPTRGASPARRGLVGPRVRHSNADGERSEKLSDRANAKRGAEQVQSKGENRTSCAGVNEEQE